MKNQHTTRVALTFLALGISLLEGCATTVNQPLKEDLQSKIDSTQTFEGVKQGELYAAINPSMAGATGAAACGAVPGIGLLLAAVCGGIAGAADAGINASRAKEAEATVRPLKDELVGFDFDQTLRGNLNTTLKTVGSLHSSDVTVTKDVKDDDYDKLFRDSKASAVLFVNADYHLSPDFSTLVISTQQFMFPRDANLRTAAGQKADLGEDKEVNVKNAIYRNSIIYQAKLPGAGQDSAQNVEGWKSDGGALLRQSLENGTKQISQAIALDMKQDTTSAGSTGEAYKDGAVEGTVISQSDAGKLVRVKNGTLLYVAQLTTSAATAPAADSAQPVPTASN